MKFVSFIITNWNGLVFIKECLGSIKKQSYTVYEIIVVDNGSSDGSVQFIRDHYPEIKLIALGKNFGFARGNGEGFKSAKGDFIAIINNDVILDNNWLFQLVSEIEKDEKVGIWASQIVQLSNPNIIDSAGDGCVTSGHGFKVGNGENGKNYSKSRYTFGACAAASLYRKEMLDDIGFFDEDYFLNCEDTDLNFRAQLRGWKCLYVPTAVAKHRVSATIGRISDLSVYYLSRNEEFVYLKNMPLYFLFRYFHHKIIQEIISFLYFAVKKGKWKPFLMGKIDAVKMIPIFLKKRRKIQKDKRINNYYLKTILTPIFNKNLVKSRANKLLFP